MPPRTTRSPSACWWPQPAYAVEYWQDALAEMVESATWKDIAERDQFTTTFMVGDELDDYLEQTQDDVRTALEETGRL